MIWCWAGPIESVVLKLGVKIPCHTRVICGCSDGSTSFAKWHNNAQDCWKLKNESLCVKCMDESLCEVEEQVCLGEVEEEFCLAEVNKCLSVLCF